VLVSGLLATVLKVLAQLEGMARTLLAVAGPNPIGTISRPRTQLLGSIVVADAEPDTSKWARLTPITGTPQWAVSARAALLLARSSPGPEASGDKMLGRHSAVRLAMTHTRGIADPPVCSRLPPLVGYRLILI
jgi:hypothetical protein